MRKLIRICVFLSLIMCSSAALASAQVSGQWKLSVNTQVGGDEADLVIKETDGKIEGTYSGILGSNKPLKGSYKDKKLALSFEGEWPPDGSMVEVKVTGELSADAGSGEVVVVNRTDGTWTARRVKKLEESKPALESTPAPVKPQPEAQFDRFVGEWNLNTGAAQIVENAIQRTTETMGMMARGVARGRLSKAHAPPPRIRLQREGEFLTIEFEGAPARRLPISGAEIQDGESKLRLQLLNEPGGGLLQIGETREGKRENLYRIGDRPQLLSLSVTVTSPRLPAPLQYSIEFTRAQPAFAPRQAQPGPLPSAGPGQSGSNSGFGPNLGDRFASRDRDAPRREALQSVQVIPHINGLLGGFELGAGFGAGLELTTANKIPGVELYARAIGTTRLYRKGELGAVIGNQKTHGEVWFSYRRHISDNFFGVGPRTSDANETNYSVERRSYNASISHRFAARLKAGVYAGVSNTGSFLGDDEDDPPIDARFSGNPATTDANAYLPGFNTNAKLVSFGVFAELDLRNNDHGLTRGAYFYGRFGSTDGLENNNAFSDYAWNETELDARIYIPLLSEKTSLALRAYADLKQPKGGSQIPFYDLSWLGGRTYLRGFDDYRFRGNNAVVFSGELRRTLFSRSEDQGFDLIGFTDGGQVWGDHRSKANPSIIANDRFESQNWRIGAGGGVQVRMSKNTVFRFDVAASNEKTRAYFTFSRGF